MRNKQQYLATAQSLASSTFIGVLISFQRDVLEDGANDAAIDALSSTIDGRGIFGTEKND